MSFVLAAAALAFSADKSGMELIELKSGNVLKGEVLKERAFGLSKLSSRHLTPKSRRRFSTLPKIVNRPAFRSAMPR